MERARLKEVNQADPWMIAEVVELERFSSVLLEQIGPRKDRKVESLLC